MEELKNEENVSQETVDTELPLDKNVRLMSPTQMLLRRFFRSKLSIIGLVMVIGLFVFSFLGPLVYTQWGETDLDESGKLEYTTATTTYIMKDNFLAAPSAEHPLGTDNQGYDVLARLMYGGRVSLIVSFMTVILLTVLGVIIGGIAGYFGGAVDNVIMRICDILMCLPGIPILLIISSAMDGWFCFSW